jgi:hypothetical protein
VNGDGVVCCDCVLGLAEAALGILVGAVLSCDRRLAWDALHVLARKTSRTVEEGSVGVRRTRCFHAAVANHFTLGVSEQFNGYADELLVQLRKQI